VSRRRHLFPETRARSRCSGSIALAGLQLLVVLAGGCNTAAKHPRQAGERHPRGTAGYFSEPEELAGHERAVWSVAFSPDGTLALSGSADRTLRLWDVERRQPLRVFKGHRGEVKCVAFLPQGGYALSGGFDSTVRLWNLTEGTGKVLSIKELKAPDRWVTRIDVIAVSASGRQALIGGEEGRLVLWNVRTEGDIGKQDIRVLEGHQGVVGSAAFSRDGRSAISVGIHDDTIRLWDAEAGREIRQFVTRPDRYVHTAALSPDATRAVSGDGYGNIVVWDVASGRQLRKLGNPKGMVFSIVFTPDGNYVLTAGHDGATIDDDDWPPGKASIRLWKARTWELIREFEFPSRRDRVRSNVFSLAVSPDGRRVLSGGNWWDNSPKEHAELLLWRLPNEVDYSVSPKDPIRDE